MRFNFEIGMTVCDRFKREFKGKVINIFDDADTIQVKWDRYNQPALCDWNTIMPDTPEAHAQMDELTKIVQAHIDLAAVSLEAAFDMWRKANNLQLGIEGYSKAEGLRDNPDLDLSKFEKLIEDMGWRTSTLYC